MPGLPTVQVLLDDGTGTFPHDVSAYARMPEGITGGRGRGNEMDSTTPATITVVFDNTDGRFTLGSTIIAAPSPIKIDNRVRVKMTANAVTVNRYAGSLKAAPVSWPGGGDEFSLVKCTLVDQQASLERRPLLSIIEEECALDSPLAHYTLGEPAEAIAAGDSSGNQAGALSMAGSGAAVTFGSDTGPGTDGLTAAHFAGGKYLAATLSPQSPASIFFAFNIPAPPLTGWALLNLTNGPGTDDQFTLFMASDGTVSGLDQLGGSPTSPGSLADGNTHVGELAINSPVGFNSLYIDGVLVGTDVSGGVRPITYLTLGADGTVGTIAHVVLFPAASSAARAAAHATAALTGFAGESGTARITRLAGYAGIPVGTLDTSLTNVPFVDITGKSASDAINEVAKAEYGIAFLDGSGNLTFHNRNRPVLLTSPTVTIDANYLDEGTQFEVDMQGAINYFETTAAGTSVRQVARNLTSEITNKHGRYPASETYLVQTDAEALDRANWNVNTKGEPVQRVGSLKLDVLSMPAALQAQILALEPNAWIRITGLPSQTPGGTTADMAIQGWSPETCKVDEWSISFNVVSRTFFTAWILGDATYSVLGSTTKLYI